MYEFLIPKQSMQESQEKDLPAREAKKTGIKDLDDKINNRDLTYFDYYRAKQMGVDLTMYMQGDFHHKIANTTRATQGVYDTLKTLEMGDEIIQKAQDNSGVWNGLKRKLNHLTGGFFSLDHELAQTDNLVTTYAYATARSLGNGKTNLEQQRDAKNITAFKAKSKEENTSRMGQNQDVNLTYLKNQIAEVESLGGSISPQLRNRVNEYEQKIAYINANNGKIDRQIYKNIGKAKMPQAQSAATNTIQRFHPQRQ